MLLSRVLRLARAVEDESVVFEFCRSNLHESGGIYQEEMLRTQGWRRVSGYAGTVVNSLPRVQARMPRADRPKRVSSYFRRYSPSKKKLHVSGNQTVAISRSKKVSLSAPGRIRSV